ARLVSTRYSPSARSWIGTRTAAGLWPLPAMASGERPRRVWTIFSALMPGKLFRREATMIEPDSIYPIAAKKPSAVKDRDIHAVMRLLRREKPKWQTPIVTLMAETYENPFRVLISCILSLRTQDATTAKASHRLFAEADTPRAMLKLSAKKIEKLIYPVGFYKTKAKNILDICRALLEQYRGEVPEEIEELLKLNGVGRKTANLVVTLGYHKPGICVDTHVHRISNRWGYVA